MPPSSLGDMVFSEQYKNNTLKNEVSYGLPRARIYLGKLAVAAVLGILMSLAVLVFYEGMCWLTLLPGEPGNAAKALEMVIYCTLAALPQWLGMLGVSIMAYFLVRSSTVAAILIVLILVVPQNALKLLGLLVHPAFGNAAALYALRHGGGCPDGSGRRPLSGPELGPGRRVACGRHCGGARALPPKGDQLTPCSTMSVQSCIRPPAAGSSM